MRTLITNGTVVNADGSFRADVLVEDELIAAVGLSGDQSESGQTLGALTGVAVDRTIDASRAAGSSRAAIDPHIHMDLPVGDISSKDDFETGTRRPRLALQPPSSTLPLSLKGR